MNDPFVQAKEDFFVPIDGTSLLADWADPFRDEKVNWLKICVCYTLTKRV